MGEIDNKRAKLLYEDREHCDTLGELCVESGSDPTQTIPPNTKYAKGFCFLEWFGGIESLPIPYSYPMEFKRPGDACKVWLGWWWGV